MPDPVSADAALTVAVGGGAALLGASSTALTENMPRKQVVATMLSGLGLGCFVPPAMQHFWSIDWRVSGITGFVLGLLCIPIVAGLKKLGYRFAEKPEQFIPKQFIRCNQPTPPESKGGGK